MCRVPGNSASRSSLIPSQETLANLINLAGEYFPDPNDHRAWVTLGASGLRPHLFSLADNIIAAANKHPPSSILVEDTSARFCGLFIARVLGGESRLPVLFIRPPRGSSGSEQSAFGAARAALKESQLGDNPLLVTEYLQSGDHLGKIIDRLPGRRISVAALFCEASHRSEAESFVIAALRRAQERRRSDSTTSLALDGMELALVRLGLLSPDLSSAHPTRRLLTGTLILRRSPEEEEWLNPRQNVLRLVHGNEALNGVEPADLLRHVVEPREWYKSVPLNRRRTKSRDDIIEAQMAVNLARRLLKELVREYKESRLGE